MCPPVLLLRWDSAHCGDPLENIRPVVYFIPPMNRYHLLMMFRKSGSSSGQVSSGPGLILSHEQDGNPFVFSTIWYTVGIFLSKELSIGERG